MIGVLLTGALVVQDPYARAYVAQNNPKTAALVSITVFIDALCLRSSNFRCCAMFVTYATAVIRGGLRTNELVSDQRPLWVTSGHFQCTKRYVRFTLKSGQFGGYGDRTVAPLRANRPRIARRLRAENFRLQLHSPCSTSFDSLTFSIF